MAINTDAAPSLRRVLGFRTVLATSTGLAYAAISFLGCVLIATTLAGDGAWLAILIAGALALLAATCFAELNSLYPTAAAIRQYIRAAFNEPTSLIIAFGYLMTIITVIAADSYIVGSALTFALDLPKIATLFIMLALLFLALIANLRGIRIAGFLQDVTTYALLVSTIAIALIALFRTGWHLHDPFSGLRDGGGLFSAVTVGVFVFSAFEWVTPLAEEVTDQRLISRGMYGAIGVLFIAYALFTLATTNILSVPDAQGVLHLPLSVQVSPVPQMLLAVKALGDVGKWWMLGATLLTGVMTFNGGFATASRFMYAAAREGTLPQFFTRINRFIVPHIALTVLCVSSAIVAVVIFLTDQFQILILVGAALEAMIYTITGLCVIQLRRRQPDAPRQFRAPLGWTIPILTILIFGVLFLGTLAPPSSQLPEGVPGVVVAIIVIGIFLLTAVYVFAFVPRIKRQLAVQQQTRRRRPVPTPQS